LAQAALRVFGEIRGKTARRTSWQPGTGLATRRGQAAPVFTALSYRYFEEIDPVSTNPIPGVTVQDLAKTLMQSFDANKDGQINTDEFGSFLGKLLSGVNSSAAAYPINSIGNTSNFKLGALGSGNVKFEGFDFNATNDLSQSAKYAFAAAAQKAGSMPTTKADAESWFNSSIKPEMEKLGHRINWVKGDKFQFSNWQGTFVVDFVRNADGHDPAVVWQIE
jgi:hypothetical protein